MKKSLMNEKRSADCCVDRTDAIANFAAITNVVIKRVHCTYNAQFCHIKKMLSHEVECRKNVLVFLL